MKRLLVSLVSVLTLGSLVAAGCGPATPAPAPTKASAAPTTAVIATKAPVATSAPTQQATAAPKMAFPAKGRPITFISPTAAGSAADIGFRVVAAGMEKELGIPVQVVNRAAAAGQAGLTEMVQSKPDGYTIAATNQPTTVLSYVDPDSQAVYRRKDFQPVANFSTEQMMVIVRPDSPFKTAKDVVDAAKAKPEGLKVGTTMFKGVAHLDFMIWERAADVRFGLVHFEGSAPALNALLGGHVELTSVGAALVSTQLKSGNIRVLGIFDQEENPAFPGVKTLEAQGWKVRVPLNYGIAAPAGVPKEIVDVLAGSIKRTTESTDFKNKMTELGRNAKYMDPQQYAALWDELEPQMKTLMAELKK